MSGINPNNVMTADASLGKPTHRTNGINGKLKNPRNIPPRE